MDVGIVWAIKCCWCGGWFYVCPGCYHGERYCDDECRRPARQEQCRRARAKYVAKLQGKQCRAAAAAAHRDRRRRGVPVSRGLFAGSNGNAELRITIIMLSP